MDPRISTPSRPDVVISESLPRPTPAPARVSFSQVLSAGATGLVQGAELAVSSLPGSPLTAAAVRGGSSAVTAAMGSVAPSMTTSPEGPVAAGINQTSAGIGLNLGTGVTAPVGSGSTVAGTDPSSSIDASLQQSAELNMYYLQIQQQVDAQNRSFTALSNVLKTEHDSAKAAIQNIHS
jgi:hypothetical protein